MRAGNSEFVYVGYAVSHNCVPVYQCAPLKKTDPWSAF